jgi:hypothetical protein
LPSFPLLFVDYTEMKEGCLCLLNFISEEPASNVKARKKKTLFDSKILFCPSIFVFLLKDHFPLLFVKGFARSSPVVFSGVFLVLRRT